MARDTKKRIVTATIEVMRESADLEQVTVRRIAERAGVGVGLVNYHFQTKDNLIDQSVRLFIGSIIGGWQEQVPAGLEDPATRLRVMLQSASDFLADYPRISRLSVLADLRRPDAVDNTMQTVSGVLPFLQQRFPTVEPEHLSLVALEVVMCMQGAFLRADMLRTSVGFDFHDPRQRHEWVDSLLDRALRHLGAP